MSSLLVDCTHNCTTFYTSASFCWYTFHWNKNRNGLHGYVRLYTWSAWLYIYFNIGIRYRDRCDNLESNLPIYLIVQGVLSLIYAVTCGLGCTFLANYRKISSWIVFVLAIINAVLTIMLIVWMVIGSVWLWNNWEDWDANRNLCANEIYLTAMASLVVSYMYWVFTSLYAMCQVFWVFCDKEDSF